MEQGYKDYIAHYGIKGQKWGIRRFQNEDGTLTEEGKRRRGIPESDTWKKSESKYLSDEELNRRNNRMQRESQYRQNIDNRHPARRAISSAAKAILIGSAIGVATTAMRSNYKTILDAGASYLHRLRASGLLRRSIGRGAKWLV